MAERLGRLSSALQLVQELGACLPELSKQWAVLNSTGLGRLKREIPERIWGELYWALGFLAEACSQLASAFIVFVSLDNAFNNSAIPSACF